MYINNTAELLKYLLGKEEFNSIMYINDYPQFDYHDYVDPYRMELCGSRDNVFIDLNGIPYLVAEYVDKNKLFPVQSSELKNEVFVDERDRDALRTVISVNIADFPTRGSDLYPYIVGNNRKYENLLNMISCLPDNYNHKLDVLLPQLVVQINYQLENAKTGHLMRSMVDTYDLNDRNYAFYINPYDVTDNAILSNFTDTRVTGINHFTHGREPMQFRITNISLKYKVLDRDQYKCKPKTVHDVHRYHRYNERDHILGEPRDRRYHYDEDIMPPSWSMLSQFYHFEDDGHRIVLQEDEIHHPGVKYYEIPCGRIFVNRTFLINPGQRIIFKFCIWKNDITIVDDTIDVAAAIKAPISNCGPCHKPMSQHPQYHIHPKPICVENTATDHRLIQEFEKNNRVNRYQSEQIDYNNKRIDTLIDVVNTLIDTIKSNHEDNELPDKIENDKPANNTKPPHHGHHDPNMNKLHELMKALKELQDKLNGDEECDHDEIYQSIKDIQEEIDDIRTNGVDEAAATRIKELEALILELTNELEEHMENVPQPMPDEEVDELINKIEEFDM